MEPFGVTAPRVYVDAYDVTINTNTVVVDKDEATVGDIPPIVGIGISLWFFLILVFFVSSIYQGWRRGKYGYGSKKYNYHGDKEDFYSSLTLSVIGIPLGIMFVAFILTFFFYSVSKL
jgi:hypothetical protein